MFSKKQPRSHNKIMQKQQSPSSPLLKIRQANLATIIQRARLDPDLLTTQDLSQLQRKLGNRAVGRLLSATEQRQISHNEQETDNPAMQTVKDAGARNGQSTAPSIQRLISDTGHLYVPRSWTNQSITFEGASRQIGDILTDHQLKPRLISALKNDNLDPDLYEITIKDKGRDVIETVGNQLPTRRLENRLAREKINHVFQSYNKLLKFTGAPATHAADLQEQWILNVKDMLPEPDDLGEEMNITLVCSLISLVKSEGKPAIRNFLTGKINGVPGVNADDIAYYEALHTYYYDQKHLMYDEMSTHPAIMSEWGYRSIYSGKRNWEHLFKNQLRAGINYIFDIEGGNLGHTLHVKMKKDFTAPMQQDEGLSDYFECYNDNRNWTENHFNCQVINIFSK